MKQEMQKAEFDIQDLLPLAIVFVVLGIAVAFGLNVIADVQGDFTANSAEYNATADTITAVGKISSKMGLIVTVVLAAIIIGILIRYLLRRQA